MIRSLSDSLILVAREMRETREQRVKEFDWLKSHLGLATRKDLEQMEHRLMSKISDFSAKQKTFNERQAAAIDSVVASQGGLTGDIAELNRIITELQNSAGEVTPEDQALLDELQVAGEAASAKTEAVATALKALDEQTPPSAPATA